jgi:AraC-like DNA-binding protein
MASLLHIMTSMADLKKSWFRYLPVTPDARRWGLYVLDAGYTLIPSGRPYPPEKHPEDHFFSWEKGRILSSFTVVYITRGKGVFESATGGINEIHEGSLFVLFPNEWHRYRPDPATGWDEYWVEFDGDQAQRIMSHPGFSKKQPVIYLGHDEKMLSLFIEIVENIEHGTSEFEHIIAAQTSQIVARLLASIRNTGNSSAGNAELIRQACCLILEQSNQGVDFDQLARNLGLSLSGFRKQFRKITGLPPGQYLQQIKINKACELLRQTGLSVGEISIRLGFESIYYFSRIFKQKTGLAPSDYRKQSLSRLRIKAAKH